MKRNEVMSNEDYIAVKGSKSSQFRLPRPNLNLRNSKTRPLATYDTFKYHIGNKNSRGERLSAPMLRAWSKDPNRKIECIYDGETWPANYWYCPGCKEYKGLQPFIEGWSDWQ